MYHYMRPEVIKALTDDVPGDFIEIGVYHGSTFIPMAVHAASLGRHSHAVDSFVGMAESGVHGGDSYPKGKFNVGGPSSLLRAVKDHKDLSSFVYVHEGFVPSVFTGMEHLRFAVAHIDLDHYQPTKDALSFVWPRLSKGGLFVLS